MNALWLKLRQQHWENRLPSERKIILLGTLFLLPIAFYFLLWQPAHEANTKLHLTLPAMRLQAEQMQQAANVVSDLRHRPQSAVLDAAAVKTAVEASATRHQLQGAITTLSPQEPNAVRISMNSVEFSKLLSWLRELDQSLHIRVDSLAVTALAESGTVSIRATLTNGNPS